jgi:outer membrane protein assembly factor BamB
VLLPWTSLKASEASVILQSILDRGLIMKSWFCAAALIAFGANSSLALAGTSASVGYQIDAAHDGQAAFKTGFTTPLTQKWNVNLGGPVSYPVVAKGMVFVTVGNTTDYGTQLFALDLNTGKTVWQKSISGTYYWSNLAYDGGSLFLVNEDGDLQAFKADKTGKFLWGGQLPNQYSFETPPNAVGGQVFLTGAGDGVTLYAVDEKTGAVNWSQGGPAGDSSPSVARGSVFVTYPCNYYSYNIQSGALQWSVGTGCDGGGGANPSYFDKRLFVQDWVTGDVVLNAKTGKEKGPFAGSNPAAFWTSGSGADLGYVINDGSLQAFSVKTSNISWSFAGDGQLAGSPIVINDSVVIGSGSGMLYVLDAQSGAQLWSANVGAGIGASSGPTTGFGVGGGMLLVPAGDQLSAWAPSNSRR